MNSKIYKGISAPFIASVDIIKIHKYNVCVVVIDGVKGLSLQGLSSKSPYGLGRPQFSSFL